MVDRTDRELAADADMARLMGALLPDFHAILGRVKALALGEETAPDAEQGIAADLKLWKEASQRELITHYNKFETPLTHAERVRATPDAAQEFATDLTQLNMQEAITEYLTEQKPTLAHDQEEGFKVTFDRVEDLAARLDTQNVTSLADKVRRDGWKPGGGGGRE